MATSPSSFWPGIGTRGGSESGRSSALISKRRQWRSGSPTTVLALSLASSAGSDASTDEFCAFNSNTWTGSIDRPSDLLVEVDEISFHLHKLPILARSGLLSILAAKFDESETPYINLGSAIPGGAEAFALAAKCCYGVDVELTPANVVALRCAAEYLEMIEEFEEGNVSGRADSYFNAVVLNSWQYSIVALQSCERLLPMAEDAHIVQKCCESIARKAACGEPGCNVVRASNWWYEDITSLSLYCFEKVMVAMAAQFDKADGALLMSGAFQLYAQKWLPAGVFMKVATSLEDDHSPGRISASSSCSDHDFSSPGLQYRFVVEKIVALLPPQMKDSAACSFLLRLLRAACMFDCSVECRTELELRAGQQLDQASVSDLLIPCLCHTREYLYDVDLVRRLLDHFLVLEHGSLGAASRIGFFFNKRMFGSLFVSKPNSTSKLQAQRAPSARVKAVSILMDSYLAEVARDRKLPLEKFHSLAEAVPVSARLSDDGLYGAIDAYLKIHTSLAEHEKKKLCRNLDCSRLSVGACMHAAQNERLPLRVVVQVLFGEQLKLRDSITRITQLILEERATSATVFGTVQDDSPDSVASQQTMRQTTNQMEIRALQQEIASMRIKCTKLERNNATMMELMEKLPSKPSRHGASSWSPWNKPSKGDGRSQYSPSKGDTESPTSQKSRSNNAQNITAR